MKLEGRDGLLSCRGINKLVSWPSPSGSTDRPWSGKTKEKPDFEGRKEGDNIEVDDDKEDQSVNQVTVTLSGVSLT